MENSDIITADLDFGELWYWHYQGKVGIIVLRLKSNSLNAQYGVIDFLHNNNVLSKKNIEKALVISTATKYRIRT